MLILVKHFEALRWGVELKYKEAVKGIKVGKGETFWGKNEVRSDIKTNEKWDAKNAILDHLYSSA